MAGRGSRRSSSARVARRRLERRVHVEHNFRRKAHPALRGDRGRVVLRAQVRAVVAGETVGRCLVRGAGRPVHTVARPVLTLPAS